MHALESQSTYVQQKEKKINIRNFMAEIKSQDYQKWYRGTRTQE